MRAHPSYGKLKAILGTMAVIGCMGLDFVESLLSSCVLANYPIMCVASRRGERQAYAMLSGPGSAWPSRVAAAGGSGGGRAGVMV